MGETDLRQAHESLSESSSPANSHGKNRGTPIAAAWARWAGLLIALPSAIQGLFYLRTLLLFLVAPNEGSFPESASVYGFISAFRTHRLYQPPLDFPWIAQIYGPLYLMVGAFFAKLFHGELTPLMVFMRGVSFASLLGSLLVVGYLCWRLEGRKTWAFGLGCFWLVPWGAAVRPDLPSAFLCLAAVAAFQSAENRSWLFFLAGCLGGASFLTKQSTLAVLVALLIDLLCAQKFRNAAVFIAGGLAVSVPIFAFLLLRREPFLENFLLIALAVKDWPSLLSTFIGCWRINEIAVVPTVIALFGAPILLREKKYRAALLAIALAWLSNSVALANIGGDKNYFILPWFLSLLLVPAGLRRLEQRTRRSWWIPATLFSLATFVLIHQRTLLDIEVPSGMNLSMVHDLTILGDNPYLELHSRQPQLMDPLLYHALYREKVWSDAALLRKIDAEDYDLVWLERSDGNSQFFVLNMRGTSFWGADVLWEMSLHYRTLCETKDDLAMVPKDRKSLLSIGDIAGIFGQPCQASSRLPQVAPGSA